jgi:hypothetical protein
MYFGACSVPGFCAKYSERKSGLFKNGICLINIVTLSRIQSQVVDALQGHNNDIERPVLIGTGTSRRRVRYS